MKKFKMEINEGELMALIHHHSRIIQIHIEDGNTPSTEISERIHTLTKRLNRDTPEIEGDPRPNEPAQAEAAKTEPPTSW